MEKLQYLRVRLLALISIALYAFAPVCSAIDKTFDITQSSMSYFQLDPSSLSNFTISPKNTVNERLYIVAEQNSPVNQLNLQAGAGYAMPVTAQLDIKAAMLYQENSTQSPTEQPIRHLAIEAGTQYRLNQAIQLYSAIIYRVPKEQQQTNLETADKEVGFKFSGEYFFSQSVSAGIHAQIIAENKIYGVQGSFHF
ncbi:hypothetical protein [Catenovulum agarivorans]|uniref:hypothetical protein n=1 Tax=Catenovulum agarivorans TaxID=1172192 RepID=UPI000308DA41|nr:hypothetical protein [Catenovulum agarivorans]